MAVSREAAGAAFHAAYNAEATILVRAPGRVNLIGEHTDYNDGYVLPFAIARDTVIAARPRADMLLHVRAVNLGDAATADLEHIARDPEHPWLDYIAGTARDLAHAGFAVRGADIVVLSDVPIGCGLSSSAALEMAAVCLFEALGGYTVDDAEAARIGQRVENEFLGLKSGIMDQFASRCAHAGHALFLDCRSLAFACVPIALHGVRFVIADTACPRGLTGSVYNTRVAECARAVRSLAAHTGRAATHLRDFSMGELVSARGAMPDTCYRRARHVIGENERTLAFCDALRRGDAAEAGALMTASDTSLREDYEVTNRELDTMTSLARALPGCLGARMTGAGFGGCTIQLVAEERAEAFCGALAAGYHAATGRQGSVFIAEAVAGAGPLDAAARPRTA